MKKTFNMLLVLATKYKLKIFAKSYGSKILIAQLYNNLVWKFRKKLFLYSVSHLDSQFLHEHSLRLAAVTTTILLLKSTSTEIVARYNNTASIINTV